MYFSSENRRYVDVLVEILFQYNVTKHKGTQLLSFVLFKRSSLINNNFDNYNNHFDIREVSDNYERHLGGYKQSYDERIQAQNITIFDLVLVAKEFNGSFIRQQSASESY
ncbi:hypothetical protein CDIK_3671 [Cucumispora dikerogammari]|nr:hypothetical protein CDIK_3671 [Cucumispora dikerogammari]